MLLIRFGKDLGVEAMSLYYHVASKEDLLDGIVDLVIGATELPDPDLDWADWARQFAGAYRRVALEHPDVAFTRGLDIILAGLALQLAEHDPGG